jgi:hypothetical protein
MALQAASSLLELCTRLRAFAASALFVALLLAPAKADAYPWMIRHEYTSCAVCHADPSGAGLLTPYGRAQSEVLLRTRYGAVPEDEDPGKVGGFLFGAVALPEGVMAQADMRALALYVKPPAPAPAVQRFVLMQADLAAGIAVGRARAAATVGYVHEGAVGASVTHGDADRLISRQHWAGLSLGADEPWLLRGGRMNIPFGLRTLEHTTWVRRLTKTDINDGQSHGLALAYTGEKWRGEGMAIVGNLQLSPPQLRERGFAGYVEHAPFERVAVGLSSMVVHADADLASKRATFRQAHGLFARFVPVKMVVVSVEGDFLVASPKRKPIETGVAALLSVDVEPLQGVHAIVTGEVAKAPNAPPSSAAQTRGWLSLAWFFLPHADLRADVVRDFGPTPVTSILGQVHGFL